MLKKKQIREYKKNGIIKIKNLIKKNDIKKILKKINLLLLNELKSKKLLDKKKQLSLFENPKYLDKYRKKFPVEYNNLTLRVIQRFVEVYNIGSSSKILSIIKCLGLESPAFSTDPLIMLNSKFTNNKKGMGYAPYHQDWRTIQGSLNCLVIWVPFVKILPNMGSIFYLPSTHKRGLFKTKKHPWFEKIYLTNSEIRKEKKDNIGIGDAFIFSSFLVHRSAINKSKKIRVSLQYRFNDLAEKSYIQRNFPVNYKHAEPKKKIITKNFPKKEDLERIF
jgi:phytanoyl-CoA hydroxylase